MSQPVEASRPEPAVPQLHRPTSAELWAWQDEEFSPEPVDISTEEVTCVVVAHNGADWLDQTIESLRGLDPRPTHIVGVDADSFDRSGEIMRRSGLFTTVVQTAARGFGAAVREALDAHDPAREFGSSATGGRWLWFLHDDCQVAPEALGALLTQVVREPDTAMVGPKILQHSREAGAPRLASVGQSISHGGWVDRHVDEGEVDQRQHRAEDVLGLDSCGLLVRREVFEQLGGFAPELAVFTDGLDLGWRATEAGHRVRTCPEAVIVHRGAGHNGLRNSPVVGERPEATRRLMAMRAVAGHRRGIAALLGSVALVLGCVLRALGFLLAKAPGRSGDELRAAAEFLGGGATRSLRARVPVPTKETAARVAELRPGRTHGLALAFDAVAGGIAAQWRDVFGSQGPSAGEPTLDELTGDDFSGSEHTRRAWTSPLSLGFVLTLIAALVAARHLIGPGRLTGERLLPSQETLGAAYEAFLAPIAGTAESLAAPWLGWVAVGSTLTFGQPEWFVTLVVLGAVPLSFLTSQVWLRHLTRRPGIRALAGVAHGLIPVLSGAVNRGAIGAIIFAIGLPLLAGAIHALFTKPIDGPESWRPAWSTALALTVLSPFFPLLLPVAAVALIVGAFFDSGARVRRALLAALAPLVVLLPWVAASVLGGNARVLLGPDAALGSWDIVPWWQLLVGRTPGPGLPAVWVSVVAFMLLWAAAITALVLAADRAVVRVAWMVAAGAAAVGVIVGRLLFQALPVGSQVRPDLTGWVVILGCALVAAFVAGVDTHVRAGTGADRPDGPLARLVGVAATLVLLAGGVGWAVWAVPGLSRQPASDLPAFVVNSQTGPAATRTLAIDLTGEVPQYQLVDGDGPRLGESDRGFGYAGSSEWPQLTRAMVASMVSGSADESVGETLEALGVGHVWVRGASETERIKIANTPGLSSGSGKGDWHVWTLPGTAARVSVENPDRTSVVVPSDGRRGEIVLDEPTEGRRLLISEPHDRRWRITLDDAVLNHRAEGQRAVVDLPAKAGVLRFELLPMWPRWVLWLQLAVIVLMVVFAAPSLAGSRARRRAAWESGAAPARAAAPTRARAARNTPRPAPPSPPRSSVAAVDEADLTRPRQPHHPYARPSQPENNPRVDPDITAPRRAAAPDDTEWETMVLPAARARRAAGPVPDEEQEQR